MRKFPKLWAWALVALSSLGTTSARAYVSTPVLVPAHPMPGQTVSVQISYGQCDNLFEYVVTREGNAIHVEFNSTHATTFDWCIYSPVTFAYPIGSYEAGTYTVQVDRHYQGFFGNLIVEPLATLNLAVGTESIPTMGPIGAIVLMLGLVMLGWRFRRHHSVAALTLLCLSMSVRATEEAPPQFVEVLISAAADAPKPQQVVTGFRNGNFPIAALTVESPVNVAYLMPRRAAGDFLAWIDANPDTPRARMERYVVVQYSPTANVQNALTALRADKYVKSAYVAQRIEFSSVTLGRFDVVTTGPSSASSSQYGRDALNVDAAWQLAGGYALVGDIDSGLYEAHSALRQFASNGSYLGGNFVPSASLDIGQSTVFSPVPNAVYASVDEARPIAIQNSYCDPDLDGYAIPFLAGHGTHTAGLIAANPDSVTKGSCKHCGVAMWKVTSFGCDVGTGHLLPFANNAAAAAAIAYLVDSGAQVISMSFGSAGTPGGFCASQPPGIAYCDGIAYASAHGVTLVAASGNDRTELDFPANDTRVIGAGGFDGSYALWDESPGNTVNCPVINFYPPGTECGSNYTVSLSNPKQELVAAAPAVLSTTYPNKDWAPSVKCGDGFPGPGWGGGTGLCTGTSMSAPQVAGLVGLLRSINPLVLPSKPVLAFGDVAGIRTVLAQTTFQAQAFQPWSQTSGYGRPDAAAAAARMLGKVESRTVKNRATPLFRFYGTGAKDWLETTSPQQAIAFALNQTANYTPQGSLVPGYSAFPQDPNTTPLPAPRASVYVMTTEYKPRPEWPALIPLYLIERSRAFPVNCSGGPPCNINNRDFTLVTTAAQLEQTHNDGYSLRTIQGYIYQPCSNEPNCIPPGAEKLYRECKTTDDDCATFLESERSTFELAGYTTAYPAGSSKVLGYAYPYADTDNDGLVDGFEYVIGTRTDLADSDSDASPDGAEFPMVGVPVSDPCSGVAGTYCPSDTIFKNGFQ